MFFTKVQMDTLASVEPVIRRAKAQVDDVRLPALASGVDNVLTGLATALAGLEEILKGKR
jgi:hypothetical protein